MEFYYYSKQLMENMMTKMMKLSYAAVPSAKNNLNGKLRRSVTPYKFLFLKNIKKFNRKHIKKYEFFFYYYLYVLYNYKILFFESFFLNNTTRYISLVFDYNNFNKNLIFRDYCHMHEQFYKTNLIYPRRSNRYLRMNLESENIYYIKSYTSQWPLKKNSIFEYLQDSFELTTATYFMYTFLFIQKNTNNLLFVSSISSIAYSLNFFIKGVLFLKYKNYKY